MQLVTISNRPALANETLAFVAAWMPFIDEVIFLCPGHLRGAFATSGTRPRITAVAEEEVLGEQLERYEAAGDHQIRNWLLRTAVPRLDHLGETFLMADDDSRPLMEIPLRAFVEGGRHHAYRTYDLGQWRARSTDYDLGQHRTREILARRGFPTLSYSAHMPQVFDRALFAEVVELLAEETRAGLAIDEWSAYFNIARARHPERFHPPTLYRTLCWPALPTDWEAGVRPATFRFENVYPALYGRGALFEGVPQAFEPGRQERHSAEKVRRRQAVQKVYDSWTARGLRRAAWRLRRAVKAGRKRLADRPSLARNLRRITPPRLRRWLRRVAEQGDDPAWSFPSFMSRYRCRRAD